MNWVWVDRISVIPLPLHCPLYLSFSPLLSCFFSHPGSFTSDLCSAFFPLFPFTSLPSPLFPIPLSFLPLSSHFLPVSFHSCFTFHSFAFDLQAHAAALGKSFTYTRRCFCSPSGITITDGVMRVTTCKEFYVLRERVRMTSI